MIMLFIYKSKLLYVQMILPIDLYFNFLNKKKKVFQFHEIPQTEYKMFYNIIHLVYIPSLNTILYKTNKVI